jgi:hypothetical protein
MSFSDTSESFVFPINQPSAPAAIAEGRRLSSAISAVGARMFTVSIADDSEEVIYDHQRVTRSRPALVPPAVAA